MVGEKKQDEKAKDFKALWPTLQNKILKHCGRRYKIKF